MRDLDIAPRPSISTLLLCAFGLFGCPARSDPDAGRTDARDDATVDGESSPDGFADGAGESGSDVSPDVSLPRETVRAMDDRGSITVGNDGASLRLAAADGRSVLATADGVPWLEVGTRRGGASRTNFHDVRLQRAPGVAWAAPDRFVARTGSDGLSLASSSSELASVRVRTARIAEGAYSVTIEGDANNVAMLRLNFGADDGAYVGFGERFGGTNARGAIVPMQLHLGGTASGVNEVHVPVPFFVNSRGYGVFVRSRMAGAFDVASSRPSVVSATFEASSLEVIFFVDPDPINVIARYTRLSGLPRLPPYWAHGHMQWRNAWRSRDELFEDARRLRAEGIPTTTIWIDNPWQRSYNDAVVDEARFPDPPTMFSGLRALGYRVLVWHTPYLDAIDADGVPTNPSEVLFGEFRTRNQLVRQGDPPTAFVSPSNTGSPGGMEANGGIPDFTQTAASDLWTDRLRPVVDLGVRAFKLDYGEDIIQEVALQRPGWSFGDGTDPRIAPSLFPHWYHRAYRNALDRFAGGDGFLLVRASSWGGQSVCDIVWPGDLDNDFRAAVGTNVGGLPAAVNALINLSASGFPSFASDTGGYRGGRPTREALLRWAEHSALALYMQLGGGGESHNPWSYDPAASAIYGELAKLHDSLVPYWRALAIAASRDGTPPVRALALAFPSDPGSRSDPYAYLLGEDLYAVPVVEAGVIRRSVHIPPGRWVHWYSREGFTGPMDVTLDAPLGRPLVFVRQGGVLPMLAEDVVTLAETDAMGIVDARDRREILRARVVAGVERTARTADGASITARAEGAEARIAFAVGTDATELRAEIDWENRLGATGEPPVSVSIDGGPALATASVVDVRAGRCTACWAFDLSTRSLFVTVRGAGAWRAR